MSYQLTLADVRAVRTCDSVCFDYSHDLPGSDDVSQIRCTREKNARNPWAETHTIPVTASLVDYHYGTELSYRYGFEMMSAARYSDEWRTVSQLVKVGDTLTLEWHADSHTNDYCKRANLHADSLTLRIERPNGKVTRRLFVLLFVNVCPVNSARMLRHDPIRG